MQEINSQKEINENLEKKYNSLFKLYSASKKYIKNIQHEDQDPLIEKEIVANSIKKRVPKVTSYYVKDIGNIRN